MEERGTYLESRFVPVKVQIPLLDVRIVVTNHAQVTLEGPVVCHVKPRDRGI